MTHLNNAPPSHWQTMAVAFLIDAVVLFGALMSLLVLRAECGHVAAAGPRCRCGHGAELHDLARDNTTRKGCSVSVGPKALRCPCNHYQPETDVNS